MTKQFVQNGTGSISVADLEEGLRQLNVFDGMSKEQARLATRRFDHNGDGTVSLPEFLAFVGRPYAANDRPLEAKLRRVLLKAESVRAHLFLKGFVSKEGLLGGCGGRGTLATHKHSAMSSSWLAFSLPWEYFVE